MNRLALLAVACLALSSFGCKPKAGASCKSEAKEVCVGDRLALVCHDGKWDEMACRGPGGCAKNGEICDQTVAEEKDVCNLAGDYVCSADGKTMLECQKNKWTLYQSCFGERACTMEQKKVRCDNSLANLNEVCREEDDYACSIDRKTALVCRQGKFTLAGVCRTKNGCRVVGEKATGFKVECDDSIANIGDPCDKEGHFACAPDEKQIVKCVGKKFVADDKCKPRERCAVKAEMVGCY